MVTLLYAETPADISTVTLEDDGQFWMLCLQHSLVLHFKQSKFLLLPRLESAYSLIQGAHEIWGQSLGTFMIS